MRQGFGVADVRYGEILVESQARDGRSGPPWPGSGQVAGASRRCRDHGRSHYIRRGWPFWPAMVEKRSSG